MASNLVLLVQPSPCDVWAAEDIDWSGCG